MFQISQKLRITKFVNFKGVSDSEELWILNFYLERIDNKHTGQ